MRSLSYGEIAEITARWDDYKKLKGIKNSDDMGDALNFIQENEIDKVYTTDEEQDEIISLIGYIESNEMEEQ